MIESFACVCKAKRKQYLFPVSCHLPTKPQTQNFIETGPKFTLSKLSLKFYSAHECIQQNNISFCPTDSIKFCYEIQIHN